MEVSGFFYLFVQNLIGAFVFDLFVQNLVGAFVETQNQAVSKIRSLEEEIDTHQQHINTLKRELSDAVRREYDESVGFLGVFFASYY